MFVIVDAKGNKIPTNNIANDVIEMPIDNDDDNDDIESQQMDEEKNEDRSEISPKGRNRLILKGAFNNSTYSIVAALFFTSFLIPLNIYELYVHRKDYEGNPFSILAIRVISTFLVILLQFTIWIMCFIIFSNYSKTKEQRALITIEEKEKRKRVFGFLQSLALILATVYVCFNLICQSMTRQCDTHDTNNLPFTWSCNAYHDIPMFPMNAAIKAMSLPIFYASVSKEEQQYSVYSSWVLILFTLTVSAIILNSLQAVPVIILYADFSFYVMFDNFSLQRKIKHLITDLAVANKSKQDLLDEQKTNQMKDVIANVAHDLKTPLSSFMTGADLIIEELKFCQRTLKSMITSPFDDVNKSASIPLRLPSFDTSAKEHKPPISLVQSQSCTTTQLQTVTPVLQSFNEILDNLKNMKNTNAFMLMTINRCMDFAKASRGLQLIPKLETIDFKETLELPLSCMSNIQDRIQIIVKPYPIEMCNHIITDKQWLQENILCLLSNAVKYSAYGAVTVTITLRNRADYGSLEEKEKIANKTKPKTRKSAFSLHSLPRRRSSTTSTTTKIVPTINEENSMIETSLHRVGTTDSPPHTPDKKVATTVTTPPCSSRSPSVTNPNADFTHFLLFEFEDTGIGMSEAVMKELFSPFKQTQRLAGGTGLGLYSLTKRIEQLKGYYGVRGRNDGQQGSLFWFAIPYRPDLLFNDMLISQNSMTKTTSARGHLPTIIGIDQSKFDHEKAKLHILLAEDTPSISKMTSKMLERAGFTVEVAENGQIAFDKVKATYQSEGATKKYDVVLMDLQMPVMDGLESTKRIREYEKKLLKTEKRLYHQLILGVTAATDTETFDEGIKVGIDNFMPKPFPIATFSMQYSENNQKVNDLYPERLNVLNSSLRLL